MQLITRLISSETGLSSEKLRTGKLEKHEWEQLNVKVKALEKLGIEIVERSPLETGENDHNARYLATKAGKLGHLFGKKGKLGN